MRFWFVFAVVALSGCAAARVEQRASQDFKCAESEIRSEELGGGLVGARGCGKRATYRSEDGRFTLASEIVPDDGARVTRTKVIQACGSDAECSEGRCVDGTCQ